LRDLLAGEIVEGQFDLADLWEWVVDNRAGIKRVGSIFSSVKTVGVVAWYSCILA
jgi:hypothetical protein